MHDVSPADLSPLPAAEPPRDCPLCPRLVDFRMACRAEYPDWYNAPVPAFGDRDAGVAVIGLAPGKHGANRTGRPFTGDFAGDLLFDTFRRLGLSVGDYEGRIDDGVRLEGAIILNAVKCLPPENKPTGEEANNCRPFLKEMLGMLPRVHTLFCLGKIAHDAACKTLGMTLNANKFGHGAVHEGPGGLRLVDSYHCSRYNQNTGRLTDEMFMDAMRTAAAPPLTGERASELRTERLVLRRARADDAAALHILFTDPETMAHWSTPAHEAMSETEEWLRSMIEVDEAFSDDFIIEWDGDVIGKCGLWQTPEIGFMIRREQWGKGLGGEALEAFVAYIAGRGLPYLFADVDPHNRGSIRLLEKAGFKRSGHEEKSMQIGGRWVDSLFMRRDLD